MSSPLDSNNWYRVCDLKPRLRHHVRVHRHIYRRQKWFVLANPASGRNHRIDHLSYELISLMDGQRSLDQVWLLLNEKQGEQAPTQDQVIALLGKLHNADILHLDALPDTEELFSRHEDHKRSRLRQAFRSPFFLRMRLLDPERILNRWAASTPVIFNRWSLLLFLLMLVAGTTLAAMNWSALVTDARNNLLSPVNLIIMWMVFPVVKTLHELGHALAVKHWGGEVHDTGLMFLVFMPVPYVDASAANAFENKWARITVSAAGILVELALAALAMLVWLMVEPGLVRTIALDVMTIGGISTLLFNGNPLLKFDGYYVLSDLIEIPNLSSRSSQYYGYLFRRYLLGLHQTRLPASSSAERNWLLFYGFASFAYRAVILIAILLFVASISLSLAVILGAWGITGQLILPTFEKINRLLQEPQLGEHRLRAVMLCISVAIAVSAILLIPMPQRSVAEGTVWMDEDARLRAGTDCFVEKLLAQSEQEVKAGSPLIQCSDPFLHAKLKIVKAEMRELQAEHLAERSRNQIRAFQIEEELQLMAARLADADENASRLVIRSPVDGVFVMPAAEDLPGRYIKQGELLGYVIDRQRLSIRVAIEQENIGRVRSDTQQIRVRLANNLSASLAARLMRIHPGASRALPSAALGTNGGGSLVADPADESGRTVITPVFLIDLQLAQGEIPANSGSRVHVRFQHSASPLAVQWYRDIRLLLMRQLAV